MHFPTNLLTALGFMEPKPERPLVFMRAGCTKDSRVRRVKPDGSNAYSIRAYLKNPNDAGSVARRVFRQAIILRAINGQLRHYPLWLLFSTPEVREQSAIKHNQQPPTEAWVRAKRKQVGHFLKVQPNIKLLEQTDSLAQPKD